MSFFAAAMWSTSALLILDVLAELLKKVRGLDQIDLVSGVLCESIAFLLILFVMLTVHERERPLSDALALRRPPLGLCLLAVAIGIAMHGPLTLISTAIYDRYPLPETEVELMRAWLTAPTVRQKVGLVAAAGLLGPIVEEMFFRGGMLRSLRRENTPGLTVIGVSLLFAIAHVDLAHLDLRNFVPTLLGGLAMGFLRILSGSLWPSILLHVAFNSGTVVVALMSGPDADLFTRNQNWVAALVTLGLVALYGAVAVRSPRCVDARELDVA
jgi:membrane protease YdiL (CAAX protease family)